MSTVEHAVRNVMAMYIGRGQMFTVYQIWCDAQSFAKTILNYNEVRKVVESVINDNESLIHGWTRTVGHHLRKLDNKVGKVGEAPQIYHPVSEDILDYDPDYRLYNAVAQNPRSTIVVVEQPVKPTPVASVKTKKSKKGLFKFKVWFNGSLVGCNLVNPRGNGGKFVSNQDYEGHGVLDTGVPVLVKQDVEGKLYAVGIN